MPVVVVGNLTVGGNGKTPTVIALAKYLLEHGLKPGIVSRGYGRTRTKEAVEVLETTSTEQSGDEPKEIFLATGCPVFVHEKRFMACEELLKKHQVDVIISDDGLQHLALPKDITLVVMSEDKPLGNGFLLPAGPLREPASRLSLADHVIFRTQTAAKTPHSFLISPSRWVNVLTGQSMPLDAIRTGTAIASIAKPERFWQSLDSLDISYHRLQFPDHYALSEKDLLPLHNQTILMTRKDAVKCQGYAAKHMWYIEVEAHLPENVLKRIHQSILEYGHLSKPACLGD